MEDASLLADAWFYLIPDTHYRNSMAALGVENDAPIKSVLVVEVVRESKAFGSGSAYIVNANNVEGPLSLSN